MGRVRLIAKNFTFGLRNEPEQLFRFATVRPSITEAALKCKVSADCPSQANRGHLPGHGESREKSAPRGRSGRFLACREQLVCRSTTLFLPEFPTTLRLRAASVTSSLSRGPLWCSAKPDIHLGSSIDVPVPSIQADYEGIKRGVRSAPRCASRGPHVLLSGQEVSAATCACQDLLTIL
jgi:hypothetical protein